MARLTTDLCGLKLRSPLILASGPLSCDGEALLRAHRAGAGAVVTKTIRRDAARNPVPHMAKHRTGLLNTEKWSDLPASAWVEREIPLAKEGGATVIASLGMEAADAAAFVPALLAAGADAIEVCSYNSRDLVPMVDAVVPRASAIPVLAKVSANWPDVTEVAIACLARGAAGITAIDSVGPALRIDIERRTPRLGGGYGWLSGDAILPISLRVVAGVAVAAPGAVIVGTGGLHHADDCVEMLMAGARALGLCTLPIVAGVDVFARLASELSARLGELGYEGADQAVGAALPALARSQRKPLQVPTSSEGGGRPSFGWDSSSCAACGLCVRICPYLARKAPDHVAEAICRFCGLCSSACPTGSLSLDVPEDAPRVRDDGAGGADGS